LPNLQASVGSGPEINSLKVPVSEPLLMLFIILLLYQTTYVLSI